MGTFQELICSKSTISNGTICDHMNNLISGGGGDVVYMVQGILKGTVQKINVLNGDIQKIEPIAGFVKKKVALSGEMQSIKPLQGLMTEKINLKGDL